MTHPRGARTHPRGARTHPWGAGWARALGPAGLVLLAWLAAAAGDAGAQPAGAPSGAREQARRLVVMIDGRFGDEATRGAGLVVGTGGDRLYIATAAHVVRRDGAAARDVTVRLLTAPGQRFPATVLEHADRWLDLAVLSVAGERGQPPSTAGIPFASLGAPQELKQGDPLFAIGQPLGTAWGDNLTPYLYRKRDGDQFSFEALSIQVGHSGGGVFDQHWRLVGMVVRDEPPDAVALAIDRIIARLADWGYPIALMAPQAGAGAAAPTDAPAPRTAPADRPGTRTPPADAPAARTPPSTRADSPATPAGDDLRARVLTALRARQIEGLSIDVEGDATVSVTGTLGDPQGLRNAMSTIRTVRGVRVVAYRIAVRGQEPARRGSGPAVAPDVLLARVQHNLAQARAPAVQVTVDPALAVHVAGTLGTDTDLLRVLGIVRSAGARGITYEVDVVGRHGR